MSGPKTALFRPFSHQVHAMVLIVTLAGCAARSPAATTAPARDLPSTLDSILDAHPVQRTHWGVLIRDARTSRTLYARNAERHFIPASNTKLVVTLVAMGELGPDWRYRTAVDAVGESGGTATALIVRGSGDPTLSARFEDSDFAALDSLAAQIARAGIRHVSGDLVIDASRFADERVHSAWEVGDLPFAYATPTGAFAIGEGAFRVVRNPGSKPGEAVRITVLGGDGIQPLAANVTTDTASAPVRWDIAFLDRRDTVHVNGFLPAGRATDTTRIAVADAERYAGRAFLAALARAGVHISGSVNVARDTVQLRTRFAGQPVRTIAVRESPPVSEIVAAILKPSQNWIAEQLLKTLGHERGDGGSWRHGLAVERRYLTEVVGIDSLAFNLRDASGLTAQNLLTPSAIAAMLEFAARQPWAHLYRAALPTAREEDSTLESRLAGLEGRIHAKTGTIANVSSLSGYLETEDGRSLVFSIMSNASGLPSAPVRASIDAVVRTIASPWRIP